MPGAVEDQITKQIVVTNTHLLIRAILLVHQPGNVVTDGPALAGALALAARVAGNGPLALAASIAVIRDAWLWAEDEVIARQNPYIDHVFSSEDAREGAMAFAQKRKAEWKGR